MRDSAAVVVLPLAVCGTMPLALAMTSVVCLEAFGQDGRHGLEQSITAPLGKER